MAIHSATYFVYGYRTPLVADPDAAMQLRQPRQFTPQLPITWKLELRYMVAGERGPKAPELGHRGHRVTNSHVIDHDFGHRNASAALGGTNLRRPRHSGAGGRLPGRRSYLPRLRIGLGRLHPRRICGSALAHV